MTKFIVWDPDYIYELSLAKKLGFDLFPDAEIISGDMPDFDNDDRKKIVVKYWWPWQKAKPVQQDLSWADLIIFYTQELVNGPWQAYCERTTQSFNNKNFVCLSNGHAGTNDFPPDRVYQDLDHWASKVADSCKFEPWFPCMPGAKKFDALLGNAREHRLYVYQQLQSSGLLGDCLLHIWPFKNAKEQYTSPELHVLNDPALSQYYQINNTLGTHTGNFNHDPRTYLGVLVHIPPTDIYRNSWYSLIAETQSSDSNFFTEKTIKALFAKRVFVMFGSCGQLARLRQLGYQTFENVIDESYDLEPNNRLRWKKAFDQVLELSKKDPVQVYQQLMPVLEHNHLVVTDQSSRFSRLSKFINSHLEKL